MSNSNKKSDFIIIGAGVSGLAAACLLAEKGYRVKVIESHSLAGGCASYFRRKDMLFDVGATTLSGIAFNGPLKQFLDKFPLDIKLKKIDPGVCIHIGNKKIYRHADLKLWQKELIENFPQLSKVKIVKSWDKIEKVNHQAWSLLDSTYSFPPSTFKDYIPLLFKDTFKKIRSLNLLLQNVADYLKIDSNSEYKSLVDQQLLIASQATSDKTPALIGAMALSYLNDTWYCYGGIGHFTRKLKEYAKKELSVDFHFNTEVLDIKKSTPAFHIKTTKGEFSAQQVISSIPIWNTLKLCKSIKKLEKITKKNPVRWGAITGYFRVKLNHNLKTLYHQIHHDKGSYFFSFAASDDELKTADGFRSLTVSTHVDLNSQKFDAAYDLEIMQKLLHKHFDIEELEVIGAGNPNTFIKYTKREAGCVGGIPHDRVGLNLFNYPGHDLGVEGLYQIGDTSFPGQGVVGTIQGAMNLVKKIT